MKRIIYIIICSFSLVSCQLNTGKTNNDSIQLSDSTQVIGDNHTYKIVDSWASFPGGDSALLQHIKSNAIYPESAVLAKTEGRIFISFIVRKDSSIDNIKIIRGVSLELNNECVRIVKSFPKWIPAERKGQLVDFGYILPIYFQIDSNMANVYEITPDIINRSNSNSNDVIFYPNPANEFIKVKTHLLNDILNYQIININGLIELEGVIELENNQINISTLNDGIYLVRFFTPDNKIDLREKLIKK